ncbi:MAG: tetratricopeptide repeat protein [Bacteroidetes bacterium]|nr:tetratricopeptide repeat protein [Bacteroidota bacterium]
MLKTTFASLLFCLSFCFLASCQHSKTTEKTAAQDSIPADMQKLTQDIQADPKNPTLYWERAKKYLDRKNADNALSDINQAILLKPGFAKYYLTLSDIYLVKGMARNCKEALEKAISLDSQDVEPYLKLAELSLFFKDYPKVFKYVDDALGVDANNPKAYFISGFALKEKGDTAKAIKNYQKAVDLDQGYYDAYIQLGMLYAARKNKLAAEYYNSALNLKPASIEALYNLGLYYQETEDFNKAMEAYRKILQVDPRNKFAQFNLGYIHLFYLKVYAEGAKYFTKAIEADPGYVEAWYNRGYCFELMGDISNARIDYQKALSLKPNYNLPIEGLNRLDRK